MQIGRRFTYSLLKQRGGQRLRWMSQGAFSKCLPQMDDSSPAPSVSVAAYKEKIAKYNQLVQASIDGGGPRGIERHVKTNRKVLIRERIKLLLDPGTNFLEIGGLAGFDMPYGDLPAAGVVTGIGRVKGIYCLISGNDATVKAGTYYPITVKKSGRVQNIAEINRLPCIYMPDSGGAFLPLQSEIFIYGGRGFYNQANMSSKGIPQIAVVCGSCTAGGAYNPTMSDEAIIVDRIGKIFLGGPPLVKAATGEIVTDEDLGGAFMHSSVSGCTDYFAKDEPEAFEMCRDIVESLNMTCVPSSTTFQNPVSTFSWENLEGKEHYEKMEIYGILSKILDGSCFKEFKSFYGPGLVTGTGYIEGEMVGVVANTDEILSAEALKGTHFLNMCNRRDIPVIFLQNSIPQNRNKDTLDEAILKSRGSMAATVATISVPKISVTLTACYDEDYLLMCGASFNPNLNFMWPTAKLSEFNMTHPTSLGDQESSSSADDEEFDAFYAAFNMLTDSVIVAQSTRSTLGESLRILKQQKMNPQRKGLKYPVFRM